MVSLASVAGTLENLRPWKPGQSGNPAGRPKGAAKAARDACGGDPTKLAELLYSVALDESQRMGDRLKAAAELWDRGWGKAPAFAAIEGADPLEVDDLTREIAAIADELTKRREAAA